MTPEVQLREVAQSDLPIFFEHQRDPLAVHMAAFTAPNPNDRAAFNAHWGRILAGPSVTIQTIVVLSLIHICAAWRCIGRRHDRP